MASAVSWGSVIACTVMMTTTPSTSWARPMIEIASRKRSGVASPMMSTGLLCDHTEGSTSLRAAMVSSERVASSTP